jgi:hypothetical protein
MSSPTVRHIQFDIQLTRGFFAGVKQPTCKIKHLSPSTVEFKNDWIYTPGENRDNLSSYFYKRKHVKNEPDLNGHAFEY